MNKSDIAEFGTVLFVCHSLYDSVTADLMLWILTG